MHSPPYHPESNGSAERGVQSVKRSLKKYAIDQLYKNQNIDSRIKNLLFLYRSTPSTVTGKSPFELMFIKKPICHLDKLKLNSQIPKNVEIDSQSVDIQKKT